MTRILALCLALLALPASAQDAARGERLYADACAVCHGFDLRGEGPMAELLVVAPPDLTAIEARYGLFPAMGIARRIDGRDPLLSHGGEMPLFGYIFGEMSQVMRGENGGTLLTAPEVVDIVAYLESRQEE